MNPSSMTDKELLVALCGPNASNALEGKSLADLFGISVDNNARHSAQECRSEYMTFPQLHVAKELLTRALLVQMQAREVLENPEAVKNYLRLRIGNLPYEVFGAIFLDTQHRFIACVELFRGTLTETAVYPREIVREALHHTAASVVLFHNHPSGDLTPSRADENITYTIRTALSLFQVRVSDHVIVSSSGCRSMSELGLI
jgi:DNA repair protein RadC